MYGGFGGSTFGQAWLRDKCIQLPRSLTGAPSSANAKFFNLRVGLDPMIFPQLYDE